LNQQVKNLSGGNQQKVVIAKTLAADSSIIFFDEPTRGIDIGARYEIYTLMNKLAEEGKCIVMISSDMEELLGMSDRIIVFSAGILEGELQRGEFDQNKILELSSKNLNNKKLS
jgi:ribose transport system ATP-binding protein